MNRHDAQNEGRISALISDARRISNPVNRIPAPPSHAGASQGAILNGDQVSNVGELDRAEPPQWFDPQTDDPQIDATGEEVPLLSDDVEIPDPTSQDAQSIGRFGTEALAYYAPFHFYGPSHWGIYIRDWGVAHLACAYKGTRHLTPSDAWILRGAYRFLLEHEMFHFRTELAATRLEFLSAAHGLYNGHFHDRHAGWLEEAMANASAYRKLAEDANSSGSAMLLGFVAFLKDWMLTQPAGYRDYERWSRSNYYYAKGMRGLTARMLVLGPSGHPMLQHADPYTLDLYKRSDFSMLPVRRVRDSGLSAMAYFKPFPRANGLQAFVYTRDHPPPHVHIEFVATGRVVKLRWRDLEPLDRESRLSGSERRAVCSYLKSNRDDIHSKLLRTYPGSELPQLPEVLQ